MVEAVAMLLSTALSIVGLNPHGQHFVCDSQIVDFVSVSCIKLQETDRNTRIAQNVFLTKFLLFMKLIAIDSVYKFIFVF